MAVIHVTKDSFSQEVLNNDSPVLVDFWAPWCNPCRMIAPLVDEVAQEVSGKAKVCKVNIDEEPELMEQFGVMSIPTLMVFRDGRAEDSIVGTHGKQDILDLMGL